MWLIRFSSVALGAKVIATAGSLSKLEVCTKYGGADEALDYTKKNWPQEVMKITDGKGVGTVPNFPSEHGQGHDEMPDVIYDPVGLIRGNFLWV